MPERGALIKISEPTPISGSIKGTAPLQAGYIPRVEHGTNLGHEICCIRVSGKYVADRAGIITNASYKNGIGRPGFTYRMSEAAIIKTPEPAPVSGAVKGTAICQSGYIPRVECRTNQARVIDGI